ncbi:MAG: hypothetical protein II106_03755, partial [Oscillospiraceae bacterium]|nr:hypothetical protein [Oscillospiraceae bacterium]
AGHSAYYYCSGCNKYFSDSNAQNEITLASTNIPALGHTAGTAVKENEVAATCTAAGSYDMVVYCTVCGAELSRETTTVPALGHNWSAWTSNNDGTHSRTCSVCNETETHDCEFGDDDVCDVCGYERSTEMSLTFSASLALDNATAFNYKVPASEVDAFGLDSFHLVVVHTAYDKETGYYDETVNLEGTKSGSYYSFVFEDIPAMALNDRMVAHLEGTKNGETWSSNAIDFNAIDYCYLVTTISSQPETLRRTLANLILFAESAQINFEYNTENLPTGNNRWTETQENLCDRTVPDWTSGAYSDALDGATVTFEGLMLDVNSRIDQRFVVNPGSLNAEDLTAEISYVGLKNAAKTVSIPGSEWAEYGSRKTVTLHEMNAGELQSRVAIVIKDANGNAVSKTLHYSVQDYAGTLYGLSSTTANMKQLMVAMINYGLRANVYLESK